MLKKPVIIILTCFWFISASAQLDTFFVKQNIHRCADSLAHAFKTKNWDLFTTYSYPALIGSLGGVQKFKEYIQETLSAAPDSAWKQYEPGKILQIVKTAKDIQTVIELHTRIAMDSMQISTTTYMVGESWNGGQHWTFFDSRGDRSIALTVKPDLSPELVIPSRKEKLEPFRPEDQ